MNAFARAACAAALLSLVLGLRPAAAADPEPRRLDAARTTGRIVIDGALDEADWRRAPVATGFVQSEPHEGEPASETTRVQVLYDDDNLYIGAFAHDSDPGAILTNELKKDFDTHQTDVFEVILDTFHDERNGYMFGVNPMGAKWDAQMVNDGRDVNSNWDGIWSVKTRIVKDGWYVEMAIPFRTLRFKGADAQSWGINFLRRIRRKNEDSFWSPIPRIYQITRVSMAGTLNGLQGVRPGSDLRLKPYVLTSATQVAPDPSAGAAQAGFDAKWGITSGLTWDFTVNTDFSQVEADEQQVNLTRFDLFFPEKRDFFLENSGVFQFGPGDSRGPGGGGGGGGGRTNSLPDNILFFSRQIGLSSDGVEIPILGGTRLTGHAGKYTIGALDIQQRRKGDIAATNFAAVRVSRNVLANSDVGVMVLNKRSADGGFNRLFGADANFRFFDNLNLSAFAARTSSPERVVGTAGREVLWRVGGSYRGEVLDARASYSSTGDRFNDELGFIPRVGIGRGDVAIGGHFRPAAVSGWLREIYPHWQIVEVNRTIDGGFDSRYIDYHLPFTFQNSAFVETGMNANVEVLTEPFVINDTRNITIPPGRYEYNEYFVTGNSDRGAAVSFNGRFGTGRFYDGTSRSYLAGAQVRVSAKLNAGLSVGRNVIDLAEGAFTTTLLTARVNYSLSTRAFLNALVQYNTDVQEWSSNLRFNVIHHPLSDFFLVYNDHRDTIHGSMLDRSIAAKVTYLMAF